jgi:hypothetical protein
MENNIRPITALNPLIDMDIVANRVAFAVGETEPIEHTLHSVKLMVEKILGNFPQRDYHRGYLGGKDNFRKKLATILPYKAKRKPAPPVLQDIRQYLIEMWDAEVINGREADDALGCEQEMNKDKSTVICTTDKDLDMIPGYHYNWTKGPRGTIYYVSRATADYAFYTQLLVGDKATDNIPGIDGLGPVRAERLLAGKTPGEMLGIIQKEYQRQYGDNWLSALKEVGNLLWIQRKEGEPCPFV